MLSRNFKWRFECYCLATSPVDLRNDMFHPRCFHQLRPGQVIRSNHFWRSPSINILILLRLNLLCRTAWGHFILVPIRHWRFTVRKRVADTRTQNAAMIGSTGLVAKQWRTAGRASIYLIIKDNYYGWTISSSSSSSSFECYQTPSAMKEIVSIAINYIFNLAKIC